MLWLYSRTIQLNFCSDLNQKYFFKTKMFFVICIPKVKYSSLMQCFNTQTQNSDLLFSRSVMSDTVTPWTQHSRLPCPSPSPVACSNSCPLSQWWHPTISPSVSPFSSCLQLFPASGYFLMSQFFASGGQSIGASVSTSVIWMNIQDWFCLGWTGWISLQSKGLSRVFSNTTVQKHQFFSVQPSLWSNSHVYTQMREELKSQAGSCKAAPGPY